jgi:6-phosphogluconolactonase
MKKPVFYLLWFLTGTALWGCQSQSSFSEHQFTFYIGTYTTGASQGIYQSALHHNGLLDSARLVAETPSPSFLQVSPDNRFLVVVNETATAEGQGTVSSFRITDDSLKWLSQQPSGGAHPCHVDIHQNGFVLVSNYTGGNISLLHLNSEGMLSEPDDISQHKGRGTTPRQEGPHAHSAKFVQGSNEIISADLGTNELWFYLLDSNRHKLKLQQSPTLAMKPGAGPRHFIFHPSGKWIYVLNELNATITQIEKQKDGTYKPIGSVSTLPQNYSAPNKSADIHITKDGKYLYASNRGHNSIAIFRVAKETGKLTRKGFQQTQINWPRNFSLSPDSHYVVVTNKNSHEIVSFRRNQKTGMLHFRSKIMVPDPVCIGFMN